MTPRAAEPLRIPGQFWLRDDTQNALHARDIGTLFKLLRQWTGASQTRIAFAIGVEQGYVSRIMNGRRTVMTIELLERIADGCKMPDDARVLLGLAPCGRSWLSHGTPENGGMVTKSILADCEASALSTETPILLPDICALESETDEAGDFEHGIRRVGLDDIEPLVSARGRYEQSRQSHRSVRRLRL